MFSGVSKEAKDMKLVNVCILYKILENWWGAVFQLRVHNYEFCEPFLFIFLQNRELLFVFHTEMFIFYLIHIQKRLKSFKEAGMKCLNNPFSRPFLVNIEAFETSQFIVEVLLPKTTSEQPPAQIPQFIHMYVFTNELPIFNWNVEDVV